MFLSKLSILNSEQPFLQFVWINLTEQGFLLTLNIKYLPKLNKKAALKGQSFLLYHAIIIIALFRQVSAWFRTLA